VGIEPTSKAWEAFVLPLNYTRVCFRSTPCCGFFARCGVASRASRGSLLRPPRGRPAKAWEAFVLPLNYTRVGIYLGNPWVRRQIIMDLCRPSHRPNSMITFTVNGKNQSCDTNLNITQLIERLSLGGKKLAIERNGELVPRSQYAASEVVDGDHLEIVVAVGGG
jgi:sulfur carrier protein